MSSQKTAIVIGTGAGGATMARELQGEYQVTILEIGKEFKPFGYSVDILAKMRKSGLFFDERLIRLLLPNMIINKTKDMVLVRGFGKGGTTTLATGNAVRYDGDLKELGINLDKEFEELYQELPITTEHRKRWTKTTKKIIPCLWIWDWNRSSLRNSSVLRHAVAVAIAQSVVLPVQSGIQENG